jgi:hypothetical protein
MHVVNKIAEGYWKWLSSMGIWRENVRDPLLSDNGDVVDSNSKQLAAYLKNYPEQFCDVDPNSYDYRSFVESVGADAKAGGLIHDADLLESDFDCGAHIIEKVVMESLRRSALSMAANLRTGEVKQLDAPDLVAVSKYLGSWEDALRLRLVPGSLDGWETLERAGLNANLGAALFAQMGSPGGSGIKI